MFPYYSKEDRADLEARFRAQYGDNMPEELSQVSQSQVEGTNEFGTLPEGLSQVSQTEGERDTRDSKDWAVPNAVTCERDTRDTWDTGILSNVRSGEWLDAQKFDPPRYAVADLIPEGYWMLVGPPKVGKSWLTLGIMLAVASGGMALGKIRVEQPRPVLYLALEDSDRRMQDRCRALLGNDAVIPAEFNYVLTVAPGKAIETVHAWMEAYPDTALIAIDTLGKVMPRAERGESSYERDYRAGAELWKLAHDYPGLSLGVNHHDRKAGGEDFVDSVSGTHGLAGSADMVIVLCRKRTQSEGVLKITGRDIDEGEYALKASSVPGGLDWRLLESPAAATREWQASATASFGDKSAEMLRWVTEKTRVQVSDAEKVFGKDARRYLARMADSGKIRRTGRGVYEALAA